MASCTSVRFSDSPAAVRKARKWSIIASVTSCGSSTVAPSASDRDAELVGVTPDGDVQPTTGNQRSDRIDLAHNGSRHRAALARTGNVGHDEVQQLGLLLTARHPLRHGRHGSRRKIRRPPPEQFGTEQLVAFFRGLGGGMDRMNAFERVGDLRGHRDREGGELVAPDAIRVGIDAHRSRHHQRPFGVTVVLQQQCAHGPRRDREDHVVDRDTQRLAGLLDVVERERRRGEPPIRREGVAS